MSHYDLYLKMHYDYNHDTPIGGWAYLIENEHNKSFYDFGGIESELNIASITTSLAVANGVEHILELCEGDITNLSITIYCKDPNLFSWSKEDSKTKVAGGIAVNELFKDMRSRGIEMTVVSSEEVNRPENLETIESCTSWAASGAFEIMRNLKAM